MTKTDAPQGVTGDRTDLRNAERLIEWYGSELRYVGEWLKWLAWDGARWQLDATGRAHTFAKETARRILALALDGFARANGAVERAVRDRDEEAESKAKRALRQARENVAHAHKSQSAPRIAAMLTVAQSDPRLVVSHRSLDTDPMLFNVANGTIDLRTGKVREHDRKDLITKLAPVAFDPNATAPTWDAFLARVQPGQEMREFLQRAIGYALSGAIREHALIFSYGKDGSNGKSTFHETVLAMMGDYAGPAARKLIFRSPGSDRHPTELANLHGKRFVRCSEIDEGQAFDEALVKDLTGGDTISARRMNEDFWSFTPTHKLFIAGNHKPTVRGDDGGIWRRMRLVPWTVTIPKEEQDTDLPAKLRAELPGVLAWSVRGCVAWDRDGLDAPAAVNAATEEYRRESDTLGQFFATYLRFEPAARTPRKALRELYQRVCEDDGAEPLGAKRFAARLRECGVEDGSIKSSVTVIGEDGRGRKETRVVDGWKGVRIASEQERVRAAEDLADSPGRDVGTSRGQSPANHLRETRNFNLGTNLESVPTKSLLPTDSNDDPDDLAGYLKREGVGT